MDLQNYLRTEGLEKLVQTYSIKVNRHSDFNNLICLKYSQLESPMGEDIVQQCRGIIFDEANNYEVVSYPFDKFFNYGEGHAPTLDWNTAKVFDKLDGSLMTLYFYRDEWRVQSSGMADAIGEVSGFDFSFAELFWQVWNELDYELPKNTDLCFMYELCTKFNRVVVRQHANNLILHGIRNIKTLKEVHLDDYQDHNWNVVDT
ncbi:MAG: RNA ligase, partial [Cyanobacteria bacterium J06600_6]